MHWPILQSFWLSSSQKSFGTSMVNVALQAPTMRTKMRCIAEHQKFILSKTFIFLLYLKIHFDALHQKFSYKSIFSGLLLLPPASHLFWLRSTIISTLPLQCTYGRHFWPLTRHFIAMLYFNVITITDNNLSLGVVQNWRHVLMGKVSWHAV